MLLSHRHWYKWLSKQWQKVQGGRPRRGMAGLRYSGGNVCGLVPGPGNGTEPRPVSSRVLPSRHVSELAVDDNDRHPFYRQTNKCLMITRQLVKQFYIYIKISIPFRVRLVNRPSLIKLINIMRISSILLSQGFPQRNSGSSSYR